MYCIGALFEVMGEPWFNIFQSAGLYQHRLRADTVAVFFRCLVTFISVVYFSLGLNGFGYAQVTYGVVHFLTLISATSTFQIDSKASNLFDFLPRIIDSKQSNSGNSNAMNHDSKESKESIINNLININTANVAFIATFSSLLKHLLTETDKIALSLTSSTYDQGIFAVANNYGSLVARMIFLPIEESSRIAFSKMASDLHEENSLCSEEHSLVNEEYSVIDTNRENVGVSTRLDPVRVPTDIKINENCKNIKNRKNNGNNKINITAITNDDNDKTDRIQFLSFSVKNKLYLMEELLVQIVQIVSTIGVMFLIFGPLYSRIVVKLLFGKEYQNEESIRTLSAVCINVFVLAVNGIFEAFVTVSVPSSSLKNVNYGYVISSIIYILIIGPMISLFGTFGLVISGSISMIVRIISSYLIINDFFSHFKLKKLLNDHLIHVSNENNKTKNGVNDENGNNNGNGDEIRNKNMSINGIKSKIKMNFENESRVIGNYFNSLFIPDFNLIIKINLVWCGSYYSSQRYFESLQGNRDVLEHLLIGGIFFFGLLYAIFRSINENNQLAVLQFLKLRKRKIA